MKSVLVGVDHSESSRRAVSLAMTGARAHGWSVTVAHVINWSRYGFAWMEGHENRKSDRRAEIEQAEAHVLNPILSWLKEQDGTDEISVTTLTRHGRPSEVLVDIAEAAGDDLIFVGRTGESNLKTAVYGSTASRLAEHSPVPVVVVP